MERRLLNPKIEITKVQIKNTELDKSYSEDKLHRLSRYEKEREMYYLREKSIKDEISALANAQEKGREEGIEQGILK